MTAKRGVTLMELVVVIAIIAILATIAFPNYLRIKQETRRADATSAVIATQGIVERYLSENNKANIDSGDMALSQFSNYAEGSGTPVITKNGYYLITIVPDTTFYTINATAIADGTTTACTTVSNPESFDQCADTACWVISISNGAKQSTNSTGGVADAATTTCW